jgi:hypothetical protein
VTRTIFVFGSNLAGRHGAGAAYEARKHHGAIYGQGEGLQGNSYAIPVKDGRGEPGVYVDLRDPRQTLPLDVIAQHVARFILFAQENPEMEFRVVEIGCGLGGYRPRDIAPLFRRHPCNVHLTVSFERELSA